VVDNHTARVGGGTAGGGVGSASSQPSQHAPHASPATGSRNTITPATI
jgi:hypothetical protein